MPQPPFLLPIIAVLVATIAVLAIVRPSARRRLAAGFVIGLGLLAGLYLTIAGALANMDTPTSSSTVLFGLAAAAIVAGVAVAVWILRAGRHVAGGSAGQPPSVGSAPEDAA